VPVELGEFAFQSLGGEEEGAAAVSAKLARAVKAYLADREHERVAWAYPSHLKEREKGSAVVTVELKIDERSFERLSLEARRRGVSFAQLVGHAALWYLAELDAGRLTQRILDDLEDSDAEGES